MGAQPENSPSRDNLKRDALVHASIGFVATAGFGLGIALWLDLPWRGAGIAATLYGGFMVAAWQWLPEHRPHPLLGPANRITLYRAALIANLGPLSLELDMMGVHGWILTGLMIFALILDRVDGLVARHFAVESRFGARLDQELDALYTLLLALMVVQFDRAGPWVLVAGGWRYAFVGLKRLAPFLGAELPFSHRRRAICAITIFALIVCLTPIVRSPISDLIAAAAVAMLSASFLIDINWLYSKRPQPNR